MHKEALRHRSTFVRAAFVKNGTCETCTIFFLSASWFGKDEHKDGYNYYKDNDAYLEYGRRD